MLRRQILSNGLTKCFRTAFSFATYLQYYEHFPNKAWVFQYTRMNAKHGSDILAVWFNPDEIPDLLGVMAALMDWNMIDFSTTLQSYIASYAITGDRNDLAAQLAGKWQPVDWPKAIQAGGSLDGVLDLGNTRFSIVRSILISQDVCAGWLEVARIRARRA